MLGTDETREVGHRQYYHRRIFAPSLRHEGGTHEASTSRLSLLLPMVRLAIPLDARPSEKLTARLHTEQCLYGRDQSIE
jgi:hypothetical protein